ncbi:Cytochrome P450 71A1 [Linum grandiflorum]
MSDLLLATVAAILVLSGVVYLLGKSSNRKLNLPPSPPSLPLIGNLFQMSKLPYRSLRTLSAQYGPLMLVKLGSIPYVIVSSADAIQELTDKDHDVIFSGRPQWKSSDALFGGSTDIIFSSYGEYWRQMKRICMLEVLSQRRVNQFRNIREQEVEHLVGILKSASVERISVDLSDAISTFTNTVISRAAFGKTYYQQSNGEKNFVPLLRRAVDILAEFCFKDSFPYLGWVDVLNGFDSKVKRVSKEVSDFLDRVIDDHKLCMERAVEVEEEDERQLDIVDILLRVQKERELDFHFTDANIKATLLDMFAGGTDTIATTLEWVMSELIKHPSIMKRAQEEVRKVVIGGGKSKIEEADINQMTYLKCIIKETLRLHAPAPVSLRKTSEAVKLKGYDIPQGMMVMINLWAIMRDPEIWDSPEEFVPDRFLNDPVDFKGQTGKFVPFGAGRRLCPGMTLALVEVELVAANLLCWFDWELPQGVVELDMSEINSVVLRRENPLCLIPVLAASSETPKH